MLLSRANLQVLAVALRDKKDPVLHQVRVEPDGSTAASDGSVLMAVSPVTELPAAFPAFPGTNAAAETVKKEEGIGIAPEVIQQARRDMPRGALGLELGYAALTAVGAGRQASAELTTTDLNRHLKVEGKKAKRRFPDWQTPLAQGRQGTPGSPNQTIRRVCVDRRALVRLLQAIDAAGPDPENAVFIEIPAGQGAGLVLRARNAATRQSIVGLAMSIDTRGAWLPLSPWEAKVFSNGAPQLRQPKRRYPAGSK